MKNQERFPFGLDVVTTLPFGSGNAQFHYPSARAFTVFAAKTEIYDERKAILAVFMNDKVACIQKTLAVSEGSNANRPA